MTALRHDLQRRFLSVLDGTQVHGDAELAEVLADSAMRALFGMLAGGYSPVQVPENTGKHPAESPATDSNQVIHEPRRGSDVEAWIKRARESQRAGHSLQSRTGAWYVLDDLLDDYREHADTGTPLSLCVQGPHPEEG